MAFLDFISNRQSAPQQPAAQPSNQPSQETQTHTVDSLPASVKAQAVEAARPAVALMEKATQHRTENPTMNSDREGGKEALRHNQSVPDKSQEAMSPTDSGKGHTHEHQRGRGGLER